MIEGKPAVEARLGLLTAGSGGCAARYRVARARCCSLSLLFEHAAEDVKIGAVIDVTGGSALAPGAAEVPAVIRFWADEAAVYVAPGASFTLWHGRAVGTGVVTRVMDEAASG